MMTFIPLITKVSDYGATDNKTFVGDDENSTGVERYVDKKTLD